MPSLKKNRVSSSESKVLSMPHIKSFNCEEGVRKYIETNVNSLNGLIDYTYEECIRNILLYQRTWEAIDKVIPNAKASLKEDWATTRFLDPEFASTKMIGRINNLQIVAALLLTVSVGNLFADKFDPEQAIGMVPDDYPYDVDSINYARGCLNFVSTIFFACTIMFGAIFTDMMSRFYTQSEQYMAVVKFYPWSIFTIVVPTWVGIAVLYVTFCIEVGIRYPLSFTVPLELFGMSFFFLFVYFLLQANSTASLSQARLYNTFTKKFCDVDGRVRSDILDFVRKELKGFESKVNVTTTQPEFSDDETIFDQRLRVKRDARSAMFDQRMSVSERALQGEPHGDNPLNVHRRSDIRKL